MIIIIIIKIKGIDWDRTWQWIAKGDLKGCTEALICSAQEQALRTNYTRFHIDHTAESPLCRMYGCKGETVAHVVSEYSKLAQTEYKGRQDNVARYIHWQLCGKCGRKELKDGMKRSGGSGGKSKFQNTVGLHIPV